MICRNYPRPEVSPQWAECTKTDMAVAVAIYAIADSNRSPEAIWDNPTPAEYDHVICAVEEYVVHGDFPPQIAYRWGDHSFSLPAPEAAL